PEVDADATAVAVALAGAGERVAQRAADAGRPAVALQDLVRAVADLVVVEAPAQRDVADAIAEAGVETHREAVGVTDVGATEQHADAPLHPLRCLFRRRGSVAVGGDRVGPRG